jgi:hypothetical protein
MREAWEADVESVLMLVDERISRRLGCDYLVDIKRLIPLLNYLIRVSLRVVSTDLFQGLRRRPGRVQVV